MPTEGAYQFRMAAAADPEGFVEDGHLLAPGEWAWVRKDVGGQAFLAIYAGCPDCLQPMTLWRRFGTQAHGHSIDGRGGMHPSVLHTYKLDGREACGFHTIPTTLLGFVDRR